jgi:hypothetical protein
MRIEVIRQIHLCLLFKCLSNPAAYVKITTLIAHEFSNQLCPLHMTLELLPFCYLCALDG